MRTPNRFFGLHAHTGASAFDGMAPPAEHFKFCLENGLDGHAITEHGHMNSFSNALLFMDKWRAQGVNFKYIPGCELYVHPDLEQWQKDKEEAELRRANDKAAKIRAKDARASIKTNIERVTNEDDDTESVEMSNALTIENEDETKASKRFNPVNRRHHLVILPKTPNALKQIFHLVSQGYLEGFYRFPRVDLRKLKAAAKACDNELLISTACLGGVLSYEVMSALQQFSFDDLNASLLDDKTRLDAVLRNIANTYDAYADAVGKENVLIELQFNRLPAQDVVNRGLIEFAKQNGLTNQLIVTPDSHYPRPELWYHREMYKKLGYLNYTELSPDSLPKSREELKAELYPKNASQMWEEYLAARTKNEFYKECDELICDAIERSHDVAHNVIGDVSFDRTFKFPQKLVTPGKSAFQTLLEQAKEGLVKRGLDDKPEYVERLKYELGVIKQMNFAEYFVTLARVICLARDVTLLGVARGSGGGSLTAYCLEITDLDPIKYNCRFDRFLNVHRCLLPTTQVMMSDGKSKMLKDVLPGDKVITADGSSKEVLQKYHTQQKTLYKVTIDGLTYTCSENHVWVVVNKDGKVYNKRTDELTLDDKLYVTRTC